MSFEWMTAMELGASRAARLARLVLKREGSGRRVLIAATLNSKSQIPTPKREKSAIPEVPAFQYLILPSGSPLRAQHFA